jgi:hypothetical protein
VLHRIVFGKTGQVLEHLPARPVSSATYVVEDLGEPLDGADRELASGSATISGVSLTTDAAAGPREADPRKVQVASTTGATTGPWWIEDASGIGELVVVIGVTSGDSLLARDHLLRSYASGSTIKPLAITASFPDAVAADEDMLEQQLRVVWTYTIDSRSRREQEQVRVVRQTSPDVQPNEVVDFCRSFAPDMAASLRHRQLETWTQLAVKLVSALARAESIEPTQLLAGDRSTELVGWRVLQMAGENGYAPGQIKPADFAAAMAVHFERCWSRLTVGAPGLEAVEIDEDDEQVTTKERSRLSLAL